MVDKRRLIGGTLGGAIGFAVGWLMMTGVEYAPHTGATLWAMGVVLFSGPAYAGLQHLPRRLLLRALARQNLMLASWPLLAGGVLSGYMAAKIVEFVDRD